MESRTVIGTTDAYRLPPIPGSAYLKVDESIYQRFRVAHVSSPHISATDRADAARVPGASIVPFESTRPGPGTPVPAAPAQPPATGPTELAAILRRLKTTREPAPP